MRAPASLAARPPSLASIAARLAGSRPVGFERAAGELLAEAGEPFAFAYLLTEGLVAIVARAADGARAEAGLVGPGGLVAHQAALGAEVATSDALALTPVKGVALEVGHLRALIESEPAVRRELQRYGLARMAEVEQICASAAVHSIEQRLARWLLAAAQLIGDRPIAITHQQFAELFGVRRASVTTSLHMLEGERAIRCRRGAVEIRDLARLAAALMGPSHPA